MMANFTPMLFGTPFLVLHIRCEEQCWGLEGINGKVPTAELRNIYCKTFNNMTESPKAGNAPHVQLPMRKQTENTYRQWSYVNRSGRLEASSVRCGVVVNLWVRDEECGMEKGVCCGFCPFFGEILHNHPWFGSDGDNKRANNELVNNRS